MPYQLTCEECGWEWENPRKARWCPVCREARRKKQTAAWQKDNREARNKYQKDGRYARKWQLAQLGLTLEEYESLCQARENRCDICGKKEPSLCVDHCHETGKLRGLLCRACNRAIGQLGDTLEDVRRAVAYLEKSDLYG